MKPRIIWLTGLPSSGKSTIAQALGRELRSHGFDTEIIDGDAIRKELSHDLGYSFNDRRTNALRVAYLCRILSNHGVLPIVALVTPFQKIREEIRASTPGYFQVWLKCPIQECIRRDTKGLYKLAQKGELSNFTGVGQPFEEPLDSEIIVDSERNDPLECSLQIIQELQKREIIENA